MIKTLEDLLESMRKNLKTEDSVKYLHPIIRETEWYKNMMEELRNEKRN